MAQLFGRSERTDDVPAGRRAVASLALVAGALSGVVTSAAAPVGAAPAEVNLICTGVQGDSAELFPDSEEDTAGSDSGTLVRYLIGQIGQPTPGSDDGPEYYTPKLSFAATARLDHDLPDPMLTSDGPTDVKVSGEVQLTDGFLASLNNIGVVSPFGVTATNDALLSGVGVSGDQDSVSTPSVTQDPESAPISLPIDLTVTATPAGSGGAIQLDYTANFALALNQDIVEPEVTFGTMSMSCETSGQPQSVKAPEWSFDPNLPEPELQMAAPEPLADGYVAEPGGVVARTDRHVSVDQPERQLSPDLEVRLDVLANDGSLDSNRAIDPDSLELSSTDGPVDVTIEDGQLTFRSSVIPYSESPYYEYEGFEFDGPIILDPDRYPAVAGFAFGLFTRTEVTYRVCDDGDPASCADGLAEVIMPIQIGDICDDPNLDFDCGPFEPPVDTTCTDDMSICEVPGCSWSDDDDRYVCTYPGKLQADPNDPPDDPPSSNDDPPSGNGPGDGRQPPLGTPLTPAFTA